MIADRSAVIQAGVRLVSPLALVVAVWLFFAGHNQPGGGFAAGLVAAAVISLRAVAGLSWPRRPDLLLGWGIVIGGIVALLPLAFGEPLLDQIVVTVEVPVLGTVKSGSALLFDAGVVAVVVGLAVAVLDGLGVAKLGGSDGVDVALAGDPATSQESGSQIEGQSDLVADGTTDGMTGLDGGSGR